MRAEKREIYPLERGPFHRLERRIDLARILKISPSGLERLRERKEVYTIRTTQEINGKLRELRYPRGELRKLHERLKILLNRCEQPEYVFSPRKCRSPWMNAAEHRQSQRVYKLDIKQFYPSTTFRHVFDFFRFQLGMSADTAYILAELCTVDDALCFGSPASPILAVLIHRDIFEPIAIRAAAIGAVITIWVDDVTVSGSRGLGSLINDLKLRIKRKGLLSHKESSFRHAFGGEITGTVIRGGELRCPNRVHLKVRDLLKLARRQGNDAAKCDATQRLIGLTTHQITVAKASGQAITKLEARLRWLHTLHRSLQTRGVTMEADEEAKARLILRYPDAVDPF